MGFRSHIQDSTDEGTELIEFVLSVFRGEHDEDTRQRMDAATWLADRGFGKPTVAPAPIMEPELRTFTIDIDPNRNMERDNPFGLPEDLL